MDGRSPDILIIPTFTRPEMLWLCLDHIAACPEAAGLDIRIFADSHREGDRPARDILAVAARFPGLSLRVSFRKQHRYHGNSYNVLSAYAEAFKTDADYVFQVEDDVLVAPDFFRWHYQVQGRGEYFCSIAAKNPRRPDPPRDAEFYCGGDYASLGVCFRRSNLEFIVAHARPEYFADMTLYVRRMFPDSPLGAEFAEQDGLIGRIIHRLEAVSAWASRPRCQHVGWYGYNRPNGQRPSGPVEVRYREIKRLLAEPQRLQRAVRDFHDIEPYQLGALG